MARPGIDTAPHQSAPHQGVQRCEGALAVQMACTHTAALAVLARFSGGGGSERRVVALASAAARLMRAYSGQVETLRRLAIRGLVNEALVDVVQDAA
jgi:hypothetical protein